ncbi:butyrophilin subfamily 1 member A1-like [Pelodytes ibericus]
MQRVLLCLTVILTSTVAALFQVLSQDKLLVAEVGSNINLPCILSPPLRGIGLEVRWFHNLFHSVVFLLKDGREDRQQQKADYRGRTLLQDGPDTGNLTLTLHNVRLSDAGSYHCFVENKSSQAYEEAVMELRVVGLGSPPLVEVSLQDKSILVSCSSGGWFPEPKLRWKKDDQDIVAEVGLTNNHSDGLFSVKSNVPLTDASDGPLYCGVRHPLTGKETGIYVIVSEDIFPRFSSWAVGFLLLLALLIGGSVMAAWRFHLYRKDQGTSDGNTMTHPGAQQNCETFHKNWRKISINKESILFDSNTAFPGLQISPNLDSITVAERVQDLDQSPERFDTEPCVLANPLFRTGTHYWETEIQERNGQFWSIGIARETVRRTGGQRESPEAGIWAIRASGDGFFGLSSPPTPIFPSERPEIVGTCLDYNRGRVTFYDALTFELLFFFEEIDFGPVYPFFYVGTGISFVLNPRAV